MQGFMISKNHPKMRYPYGGPCCAIAGVPLAKIYLSRETAQRDCNRLNAVNPVGFKVLPYAPNRVN
jgi:hypothetical protein